MRRRYRRRVIIAILTILLVLIVAWWVGASILSPYPPTATATLWWPTRITATDRPTAISTATATNVFIASETPTPVIDTATAIPSKTATLILPSIPAPTETPEPPILYTIVKDKQTVCMTYFIRAWGVKAIPRCWQYERNRAVTPTLCGPDCVIWWEPIPETPPVSAVPFTGTPIYIP